MSLSRYSEYKDSGVAWLGEVPGHWEVKRLKRNLQLLTEKTERREHPVALENIESWSGRFVETETEFQGEGVAFEPGDILFGKLRPYLAKAYLAETAGEAVGDFHVMRPSDGVDGRFAQYQILNRDFITIVDGSTFGAKMPRASWDFLCNMELATPPKTEQQTIAAFLDRETGKIDALIAEQRRLVELLAEKRQAVISHAVTKGLNPNVRMKNSGIEWLGEVPEHWEVMPLGRTASDTGSLFIDGDWIESKDLSDEGFRYLTSGNVGEGCYKEQGQGFISEATFAELKCIEVLPGDVLISRLNLPIGRACIVPELGSRIVTCVDNVIVRPNRKFDRRFIVFLMSSKSHFANMENLARGTTMQRISRSALSGVRFAFPPLIEQTQIAAHLLRETVKIDTLTAEANRAIELLQERRSALISAAVTGKIDVRSNALVKCANSD